MLVKLKKWTDRVVSFSERVCVNTGFMRETCHDLTHFLLGFTIASLASLLPSIIVYAVVFLFTLYYILYQSMERGDMLDLVNDYVLYLLGIALGMLLFKV